MTWSIPGNLVVDEASLGALMWYKETIYAPMACVSKPTKDGVMRFFVSFVILLLAFTSAAFGQDALSIDSKSNVNIKENLTVHGDLMVKGEPALPPGFIFGLETSMGTEINEIIIKPGLCRSYIGEHYVDYQELPITTSYGESTNITLEQSLEVYLRVDPSNPWSETNRILFGNTQVLPNETYHLFVIKGEDANGNPMVSAGFDSNIDCVNIPDGYTAYRRIASVTTDGDSRIREYSQFGNEFRLRKWIKDLGGSTIPAAAANYRVSVPAGLKVRAMLEARANESSNVLVYIYSPDDADQNISENVENPITTKHDSVTASGLIRTNYSSQIRRVATDATHLHYLFTRGWIDDRGQYGGK